MISLVTGLISVILALISVVAYLFGKKGTAEALLKNNDVKEQLTPLDGQIAKNQGLIDAAQEELKKKESENASQQEILDQFNNINKPK